MKFRNLEISFMRMKLKRCNFYEDVFFVNDVLEKKAKSTLAEWMTNLPKYEQKEIKKFKELLKVQDEIVFPIKIKNAYGNNIDFKFVDAKENKYYISSRNVYTCYDMLTYTIGKRECSIEPLIDKGIHYKICNDKSIKPIGITITQLDEDGENSDIVGYLHYNYDEGTEEFTLYSKELNGKIKIKYPIRNDDFYRSIFKFLLDSNETKWHYYNVLPIVQWIIETIKDKSLSMSVIAEINAEIFSEIEVVNGFVQKYTTTKIIDGGEMHIIKKIFVKTLDEVLSEK